MCEVVGSGRAVFGILSDLVVCVFCVVCLCVFVAVVGLKVCCVSVCI